MGLYTINDDRALLRILIHYEWTQKVSSQKIFVYSMSNCTKDTRVNYEKSKEYIWWILNEIMKDYVHMGTA